MSALAPFHITAGQAANTWRETRATEPEFFAEYCDAATGKCYGIRVLALGEVDLTRVIGVYGERKFTISAPMEVQRGHRIVEIKASARAPRDLIERVYPLG